MGEFITNIFNAFLELMRQFRAVDVLDIVVVAFLIGKGPFNYDNCMGSQFSVKSKNDQNPVG